VAVPGCKPETVVHRTLWERAGTPSPCPWFRAHGALPQERLAAVTAATVATVSGEGCVKSVPATRFGAQLTFGRSPRPGLPLWTWATAATCQMFS